MKIKNVIYALLLLLTSARYATAQQNPNWILPTNKWRFTSATPTQTAVPGSSTTPYINANAAYDDNNNILFYVVNNQILGPTSTPVGTLLPYYVNGTAYPPDGFGGEHSKNFTDVGSEIAIVPVPGHCAAFYVIYTMSNHFTSSDFLMYMKVDCSFGGISVSSPTAFGIHAAYPINTSHAAAGTGLAVSLKLSGTYDRYLFAGGRSKIMRYSITSSGIGSETLISSATDEPTMYSSGINYAQELELSPNQQWLAWGNSVLGKLFLINLNASYTKVAGASKTYTIADIKGVEFNAASTKVFVSASGVGANGISYATLSGSTVTTIASTTTLNNTFLERARNSRIYGVNNSGNMVPMLDGTTPTVNAPITGVTIYGNANWKGISQYRLNDQVDGDNYSHYYGTGKLFAEFLINSDVSVDCANPQQVFLCNPITLTNLCQNASSYKVELLAASSGCASYSLVHSTGTVTTFPTNAKSLPGGANGTWLQTHTGYFAIIVTAYNTCGQVAATAAHYFHLATGPSDATAYFNTICKTEVGQTITIDGCVVPQNQEFTYYGNTGSPSCGGINGFKFPMEHTSTAAPDKVGRDFTYFLFNGISAGTGSSLYTVRFKTESWNGASWTLMGADPLGEDLGTSPTIYALDDVLGGVFADPLQTPNGNTYRITVSVINECGTYSSSQIIQIDDIKLKIAPIGNGELEQQAAAINLLAYPNPTSNEVTFTFNAEENDVIDITLYDVSGRKVADVVTGEKAFGGENVYHAPVNKLVAGSYFYNLTINGVVYSGKLIKE